MPIEATRALLHAALSGGSTTSRTGRTTVFGFEVPVDVPGVDAKLLDPRSTWADRRPTTRRRASSREMFRDNFKKFHADDNIVAGGPRL